MIRRFLEFVLPLLILAAALCLLWGALTGDRGRTTYEAASPSARHAAAFAAPETSERPSVPRLDQAPVGGGGVSTAGLGDPSPGSANQKVRVAMGSGLDPTGSGGTSPLPSFPVCASPCVVDVAEWDIPTPEPPTFNGLHPIADSWRVGVASGKASHMGDRFPSSYLALPIGPGFKVRIVGPGGHVEMWSTDAGPSLQKQREGRVADLSVAVFVHVCGVPASFGLCPVSVAIVGRR